MTLRLNVRRVAGFGRSLRLRAPSALWAVLDQAAIAASGLLLSTTVAQSATVAEFGYFSIAFATYAILISLARASLSTPFLMTVAKGDGDSPAEPESSGYIGCGFVFSIITSALCLVVSFSVSGATSKWMLLLALAVPVLLQADINRFALQMKFSTRTVAIQDGIALASQLLVLLLLDLNDVLSPISAWMAWTIGSLAALFFGIVRLRVPLSANVALDWSRRNFRRSCSLFAETVAIAGGGQANKYVLGSFGGGIAVAPLRGAEVVLGPINVICGGLLTVATPSVIRAASEGSRPVIWRCVGFGVCTSFLAVAAGLILAAVPDAAGEALLGETWIFAQPLVIPMSLATALMFCATAAMLGFRAFGYVRQTLIVRLLLFPFPVLFTLWGFLSSGVYGAAVAIVASNGLLAVVLWLVLGIKIRARRHNERNESA